MNPRVYESACMYLRMKMYKHVNLSLVAFY